MKTDPAAGAASQLREVGSTGAPEPAFAAQPMQHDGRADIGSAAMAMRKPEGASVQHGLGQRAGEEAPTPKPQRTLWHPHTGESLSGWKMAVSAAHEANQQAASGEGVSPPPVGIV